MEQSATPAEAAADTWVGPCAAGGDHRDQDVTNLDRVSWDLDVGDAASWMRATRICVEQCPCLAECRRLQQRSYPGKTGPVGVIWAGVAYSELGRPLNAEGLRTLAAVRRNQRLSVPKAATAC